MSRNLVRRGRCCVSLIAGIVAGLAGLSAGQEPDLTEVLRRAAAAVARYSERSALILADESCQQRAYRITKTGTTLDVGVEKRRWRAETALIQLPGATNAAVPWIEARDVFEVDGKPLPDRKDRIQRLFLTDPDWKTSKAREITQESAKYNLGLTRRNINLPSVPLLFLCMTNQRRVAFRKAGEETVDDVATWRVEFEEIRVPALIRSADTGEDMPSGGTFWVDPTTGDVLRAELRCPASTENRLKVTYREHPAFGVRLPVEMTEKSVTTQARDWTEGSCTYSNFRRFETSGRLLITK